MKLTRVVVAGLLLCVTSGVSAQQSPQETLLTSGVVKRVDLGSGTVVLDSGRKLRPRLILVKDELVALSSVQREDVVFVSGVDLGFEETQPSALAAPAERR